MKECDWGFRMPLVFFWAPHPSMLSECLVWNRVSRVEAGNKFHITREFPRKGSTISVDIEIQWRCHDAMAPPPGGALKYHGIDPTSTVCSTWWWVATRQNSVKLLGAHCGVDATATVKRTHKKHLWNDWKLSDNRSGFGKWIGCNGEGAWCFFGKDLLVIFRSLSLQSCFMSIFMNSY